MNLNDILYYTIVWLYNTILFLSFSLLAHRGISSPHQESNLCPLQWKHKLDHWTTREVPQMYYLFPSQDNSIEWVRSGRIYIWRNWDSETLTDLSWWRVESRWRLWFQISVAPGISPGSAVTARLPITDHWLCDYSGQWIGSLNP